MHMEEELVPCGGITSPLASEASSFVDMGSGESGTLDNEPSPEHPAELIAVNSLFSVLKECLPSLTKVENSEYYYLPGNIKPSDQQSLHNYSKRIGELTLGDEDARYNLASNVFVRIAHLQDVNIPLFPSLHCLRILDTTSALDFLDVLLSAALRTLELTGIPVDNPHYPSVLSFFQCVVDQALDLSILTLGPGRIQDPIFDISSRFKNLRCLQLLDVGISITKQSLQAFGSLQHLETFIFRDNGTSTYKRPSKTAVIAHHAPGQQNSISGLEPEAVRRAPESTALHYEAEGKAAEHVTELTMELGQIPSPVQAAVHAKDQAVVSTHVVDSSFLPALRTLEVNGDFSLITDMVEKVSSANLETLSIDLSKRLKPVPQAAAAVSDQMKRRTTKSQTPQPSAPPQVSTTDIVTLLRRSIQKWGQSFVSISIKNHHSTTFSLPTDVFENFLLRPDVERLEITGIGIDSMETTLGHFKEVADPKLLFLSLPVHPTAPGITPIRLRHIAEACPHLKTLRCRLRELSVLPVSSPISHQLEVLTVSNERVQLEERKIARYLDSIFPKLESITTYVDDGGDVGSNAEEWRSISDLIKYFQAVRKDEQQRLQGRAIDYNK